jgi:hypothetical protein
MSKENMVYEKSYKIAKILFSILKTTRISPKS